MLSACLFQHCDELARCGFPLPPLTEPGSQTAVYTENVFTADELPKREELSELGFPKTSSITFME